MIASVILFASLTFVYSFPANNSVNLLEDGSKNRDVRSPPSEAGTFLTQETESHVHQHDNKKADKNEKGYHKMADDEGNEGYKHFDSYHKKNSDKYGFETHSSYGNDKFSDDEAEHLLHYLEQLDDGHDGHYEGEAHGPHFDHGWEDFEHGGYYGDDVEHYFDHDHDHDHDHEYDHDHDHDHDHEYLEHAPDAADSTGDKKDSEGGGDKSDEKDHPPDQEHEAPEDHDDTDHDHGHEIDNYHDHDDADSHDHDHDHDHEHGPIYADHKPEEIHDSKPDEHFDSWHGWHHD